MPQDIVKTKGPLKSKNPAVGGGVTNNYPVFGIVKDNIDPTRSGRIKVLIGDKSPQDPDNSDAWLTVRYMSNFFGHIEGSGGKDDNGTYKSNPTSYGQWHAPPDIGTTVICIFVNGDPNYGFYIGCVPEPEALQMVPAIGSSDNIIANQGEATSYGGATRLPVTNFNSNNPGLTDTGTFNDSPRPVHSYTASIMSQQGIIRDPIRGPISSSASREAASRVGWGISTPGRPIYEGGYDDQTIVQNLDTSKAAQLKVVARRGGHSIVMDDGDVIGRDQLVRIRTALGHQILMSDDGQTLMILHSNGQSYIELGKEGTVDIYSTNSFNVRTQGDINFHADRNINLHAMENLNIQAKNIQTNSEEKTQLRSGGDFSIGATGKLTGLAGGAIAWGAGGDASLVGGGQAYLNGNKVNIGQPNAVGFVKYNNKSPATTPDPVKPIPLVAQTDTLFDQSKGFMAAPGKLLTITSRAPAHAPWANAGQGVDIKTSMNANDNLPAPASSAISAVNQAAQTTNPIPPAAATVASAPSAIPPVSAAIGKNTTAAAIAQTATQAAQGPLAAATTQGAAIIQTAQGKVAAVGALAQTPSQLELGGVLKPGASTIVNTLVQSGANVEHSFSSSVFSGSIPGAANLTSLVQNTNAQATAVVTTYQKAQTALGAAGALTGKEAATQITGMVTAAASQGVGPVLQTTKSVINSVSNITSGAAGAAAGGAVASAIGGPAGQIAGATVSGAVSGGVSGATNALTGSLSGAANNALGGALGQASAVLGTAQGVLKAIGAGSIAAFFSEAVGGLGGIQSALTAMSKIPSLSSLVNQAEGVAASAFNAVKQSLKPLQANVPQNLTQLAKDNAAAAATVASQTGSQAGSSLLNSIGNAVSTVSNTTNNIAGAFGVVSSLSGTVGGVGGAIGSINNSITSIEGTFTSGAAALSSIASTGTAITTTFNNITSVTNTIQKSATGSVLNTTIGSPENAMNNINAIAGAGATLTSGGLPALSNAASVVQQGASSSKSSILASGISNLPGGINTISSVNNNAPGATNTIPGISEIKTAISSATTSTMNGLSSISSSTSALSSIANVIGDNNLSSNLSAASNIAGDLNKLGNLASSLKVGLPDASGATSALGGALGSIQGQLNGLTSLAALGLPVGGIAQLFSSISSLTGGNPGAIGLPSIGFNTTDRTSVTAQINTNLGDPGIPTPNLVGEIPDQTKSAFDDKIAALKKQKSELGAKLKEYKTKRDVALKEYKIANDSLPQGDPAITTAYNKYSDAYDEWQKVDLEYGSVDLEIERQKLEQIAPGSTAQAQALGDAEVAALSKLFGG